MHLLPSAVIVLGIHLIINSIFLDFTLTVNYRYFASGTGAAGLVGAFLWWELRKLGVKIGVGLSSVSHSPAFVVPNI